MLKLFVDNNIQLLSEFKHEIRKRTPYLRLSCRLWKTVPSGIQPLVEKKINW